jgi:hypothetical protein
MEMSGQHDAPVAFPLRIRPLSPNVKEVWLHSSHRAYMYVNSGYFLNSINRVVFVTELYCVFGEVRTDYLYIIYNIFTLFLGDINTGTWPSRLGESQMRQ